jgi:hypothetical protein
MKKKIYFITTALAALTVLSLSSCLKDPRYVNFGQGGTVVNFPTGGLAHFGGDAVTDPGDTIVKQFAVEIASPTVPASATDVTIAVDNSIIAAYTATNSAVDYQTMPDGSFTLSATKVTVPAGKRSAVVTVTFYKALLDPSKSYMLPIKIVSTTGGGTISGNFGIHYYHFIGNDFAGSYEHFYTRWSNGDSLTVADQPRSDKGGTTISPISPSEFVVQTNYYTGPNYDVTFTKTGTGAGATYSNWAIQFLPADIAPGTTWADNITVVDGPKFRPLHFTLDPNAQYTYAQSLGLLRFYFQTASRAIIDDYVHL